VQPDGRILMSGLFEQVDGQARLNIARLNPDGTLDLTFRLTSVSGAVERIRLLPDGRILLGGVFDVVGGFSSRRLARLNPDGTRDDTFLPSQPDADVNNVVCFPDGRMLVSGAFTTIANEQRRFLALLNPDGSLDHRFDPGAATDTFLGMAAGWGEATPILADGTLYLSGTFQRFNGLPAPNLVQVRLGDLSPGFGVPRWTTEGLSVAVHGFPGGAYPIETTADFENWEPAGEVRIAGFDPSADFVAPMIGDRGFLRLKPTAP
jgi:uncharacterized delta-60 repeat protein